MIKGRAKVEFGTGDIKLTSVVCTSDGASIGVLCLNTEEGHEIGDKHDVDTGFQVIASDVLLTFSNVESVDVLIGMLEGVKDLMNDPDKGSLLDTHADLEVFLDGVL